MKNILQNILASLARSILSKYKPKIIGITGSIGKTSAKEAVFLLVRQRYKARRSEKNFNNELGLPLTIIGSGAPGRNPLAWLAVMAKALGLVLIRQKYPEILVLEMGVDRPGDMDYLLAIAKPDIAVITGIGITHYEFFRDLAATEKEKGKIAETLGRAGCLIVNADNELAFRQKIKTKAPVLSYGLSPQADVRIADFEESLETAAQTQCTIKTPSRELAAKIKAAGETHLSSIAAACAVAEALKIETDCVQKGLADYRPAPGRLNIISGIKHSLVIDDTYNASPDSAGLALRLLARIPRQYKTAVLGDMLELGSLSDQAHLEVGKLAAACRINRLITVGEKGKLVAQGAKEAGMDRELILSFDSSEEAKKTVQELLVPDSALLIKGSQGMRMEIITKEIMAEPMRAKELLCRQYGKWLND